MGLKNKDKCDKFKKQKQEQNPVFGKEIEDLKHK